MEEPSLASQVGNFVPYGGEGVRISSSPMGSLWYPYGIPMLSLWEGAPSDFYSFASYFDSSRTRKNQKYAEKSESKVKEGGEKLFYLSNN